MTARSPTARRSLLVLAAVGAASIPAVRPSWHGRRPIVMATGVTGAPYGVFGRRLTREINAHDRSLDLRVRNTSASIDNLRLLGTGDADLALALGDSAVDAFEGAGAFPVAEPVSALARLYLNYTHLVADTRAGVGTVSDLAGLRVSVGVRGSGTVTVAQRVLSAAGVEPRELCYLGLDDSAGALRHGEIDAFFASCAVPARAVRDLAAERRGVLVPLGGLARVLRHEHGPAYVDVSVPAETYGQRTEVPTVGVATYLMARAGLPAEVAYRVTRAMFAARLTLPGPEVPGAYLDERYAIGTTPVALHAGAARYFRAVYG
ncbi:TAXI family TRAP transporter solute-binding subunit [Streptomyces mayonensis]|uniref:TAXI family TRAP transporter solute-binding subunit n=1 Tax=Streptomyces mayonensis TaxID=2750816 RepID=UPI001C1E2F9F|nr:TAXI family TRAP transporter solute-binding subunit [Streptomyces sp. A108]MBU6529640.1 TAXI family TRAP transporter solute-binding subunit [Streptomyces sp. A108]